MEGGNCGTELRRLTAARQRNVDDIVVHPCLGPGSGTGIERRLVAGCIEQLRAVEECCLGSIAVMHIEIDHSDALEFVDLIGVGCRDRRLVENAKAHRLRRFSVMAARPRRAEHVTRLAVHHRIDTRASSADAAHDGFP